MTGLGLEGWAWGHPTQATVLGVVFLITLALLLDSVAWSLCILVRGWGPHDHQ